MPLIGGDMIYSADFVKIAGKDNAEGDIATSLGLPLEQQPKGTEFLEPSTRPSSTRIRRPTTPTPTTRRG